MSSADFAGLGKQLAVHVVLRRMSEPKATPLALKADELALPMCFNSQSSGKPSLSPEFLQAEGRGPAVASVGSWQ